MLPLIAMCDRWDIGGLSTNVHFQTGRSTIFIYDGHPGGVGITQRGYEQFERLLGDAERLIAECPCESGCPSCVQSPKCGNLNEPLHKAGALELMGLMKAGVSRSRPPSRLRAEQPLARSERHHDAVTGDTGRASQGQSSRRARIAKAWDQASGVVEVGMPVRASTRSGRAPAGVAARRRSASRRRAARGRRRPGGAPPRRRGARLQALQAVGRGPGVGAAGQPSPGVIPKRVSRRRRGGSRVRRAAGKSAGSANGRTAQAAAESSPEPGSPARRTSPAGPEPSASEPRPRLDYGLACQSRAAAYRAIAGRPLAMAAIALAR